MQAKAYERGRFRQCGVPVVRFCFFSDPGGNYWSVQQPTDQKSTETVDTIDNTSLPGGGPHFAADPGVGPTAAAVSDASIVFRGPVRRPSRAGRPRRRPDRGPPLA